MSMKRKSIKLEIPKYISPMPSDERYKLRKALLEASSLNSINQMHSQSRSGIIKRKIELCLVQCDWHKTHEIDEQRRIANKRKLLLEILEYFGQRKFKSLDILASSFKLLWMNLFRALPDPKSIKTKPNEDEMDFREPSWSHLVLVYEIAFHVVTNTEIDKKIMQRYLRGAFLQKLVHLFQSLDDREPQYVKIILHAIYGRFMALRKDIRSYLSQYCYHYVYDTRCEVFDSNTSILWQGIPEILAIFCSIIQGLNVPVKQDYHELLRNVLIPLHKTYHLDAFHEELIQCCTQFVLKDAHSACVILGGMLKFWPTVSPLKEQLFIDEVVHILNACCDYIENIAMEKLEDEEFENVIQAVLLKISSRMTCPHHQVAERALLFWKEDSVKLCLEIYKDSVWTQIYNTLRSNADKYWLVEIRQITKNVIADLQIRNPSFFHNAYVRKARLDRATMGVYESTKKKQREGKWKLLKQMANVEQINK